MFKLHYWVESGGDGSAIVRFAESHEEAERADSEQEERWGESSACSITLEVHDGKIVRKENVWNGKTFDTVWRPLEETK
jgi:hypothetical protein